VPPALPGRRRTTRAVRVLLGAFAVLAFFLGALVVAAVIASSTGVIGLAIGLALALLPLGIVMSAFLWIDRFEPEPPPLLAGLFAWGAIVAALVAGLVNSVTLQVLEAAQGEAALTTIAVFVAPVAEEAAKGAGVLGVVLLRRREFDGVLDGIVCAGFVAAGFAFTENVLYFGRAFLDEATSNGLGSAVFATGAIFVLRGVLSPFAHPLFTVFTGIGLGVAAHTSRGALRVLAPLVGFSCAVLLHGWWNYSAVGDPAGFLENYLFVMVPLFLVAAALAAWLRRREGMLIARQLQAYAASGWVPSYDIAMVSSISGRRRARAWAAQRLGARGDRAMRDYQEAAGELAFLRDRAERLGADDSFAERERALLAALVRGRAGFAEPGTLR
jgi:RsiW-degrading membrane proteinase PrsW (M82 family)